MHKFICKECQKQFESYTKNRRFCSKSCSASFTGRGKQKTLGKHWKVKDTSKMMGKHPKTQFKKGCRAWNKNKKMDCVRGENNYQWKGEDVSYRSLHKWVISRKGKANKCQVCGYERQRQKDVHWANISGEYKRILDDFIELCPKCHRAYDMGRIELVDIRR